MSHRSAEWLRNAVEVLEMWGSSHYDSIQDALTDYRALLAEAEAREASKVSKERWIEMYGGQAVLDREGLDVVPCVDCTDSLCHGWMVVRKAEASAPTAAEVIEAAERALEAVVTFPWDEKCKAAIALIAKWKEANNA